MKRSIFLTVIFSLSLIGSNIITANINKDLNNTILNWVFVAAGVAWASTIATDKDMSDVQTTYNEWQKDLKGHERNTKKLKSKYDLFLNKEYWPTIKKLCITKLLPGLIISGIGAYRLIYKK